MSKFPNQLALVGVVGVSAIALAVGLGERAAMKAERAAYEAAQIAAEATESVVEHVAEAGEAVEQTLEETAEAVAESAAPAADAAAPEELAAAEPAVSETLDTSETEAPAETVTVTVDGATDRLDGQGDTTAVVGEDTAAAQGPFGLGREALPEEIAAWNLDIMPDGTGLPDGEGDVWTGDEVFAENCAVCHGDFAEGVDNWPKLAGGMNTLDRKDPVKTVGSYWPYLSTVYDYVRRSMPFGAAQTLSDDDIYAIVAYILYSNDLVEDDFVLSKETFLDVEMPNAGGFIVDDREATELEQFSQEPCMENCKESVEITMRAAVLDVTPQEEGAAAAEPAEAAAEPTEAAAPVAETAEAAPEAEPAGAETEMAAAAPVEKAAEAAAPAAAAAAPDPELVAAGEKVFKKCQACHQVGEGAKNRVGPVLNGIVGRAAGTAPDFKYSNVMADAGGGGLVWTSETLHEYLADPKGYLKGNKMAFAGLKKAEDIDAVVAYLEAHP